MPLMNNWANAQDNEVETQTLNMMVLFVTNLVYCSSQVKKKKKNSVPTFTVPKMSFNLQYELPSADQSVLAAP